MKVINYCFGLFATIVFLGCNSSLSNGMFNGDNNNLSSAPSPLHLNKKDISGFEDFINEDNKNVYHHYTENVNNTLSSEEILEIAKNVKYKNGYINKNKSIIKKKNKKVIDTNNVSSIQSVRLLDVTEGWKCPDYVVGKPRYKSLFFKIRLSFKDFDSTFLNKYYVFMAPSYGELKFYVGTKNKIKLNEYKVVANIRGSLIVFNKNISNNCIIDLCFRYIPKGFDGNNFKILFWDKNKIKVPLIVTLKK